MNALRIEGQKTVAIEIVQQFDWQVPDWIVLAERQPRQRLRRFTPGFAMMKELGLIERYPAPRAGAGRERQSALSRVIAGKRTRSSRSWRKPTLGNRDPDRQPGERPARDARARGDGRRRRASQRGRALRRRRPRRPHRACTPVPTPRSALAVIEKLVARGMIGEATTAWSCVSTANGLKFTEFKVRYHEARIPEVESHLANPPVSLPADYGQVMDAITQRFG